LNPKKAQTPVRTTKFLIGEHGVELQYLVDLTTENNKNVDTISPHNQASSSSIGLPRYGKVNVSNMISAKAYFFWIRGDRKRGYSGRAGFLGASTLVKPLILFGVKQ
jgi:hypothetical protein